MKLQKNTSLALYSVLEFAADPTRHVSAAEIAAKYGVSAHHLAKVLAGLARAGIVESVRGVGGGYRFVGNARRLTLLDVIQTFEDRGMPDRGRREAGELTPVGQALGAILSEIDQTTRATFSSITLATMLSLIERQQRAVADAPARGPQVPEPRAASPDRASAARKRATDR